mgnify:CR=1 FL=1
MTAPRARDDAEVHVLVADGSGPRRADVRARLALGGGSRYRVSEAASGADAVAAVTGAAAAPDCLVLGHALGDLDAWQVLAGLARTDGLTRCPVVVLSDAAPPEARALLRAGAQDWLSTRCMTTDQLARAVENALERWAMADELRRREAALEASEARLRLAVEASATGLWTWDMATDAVTWSAECHRIHGMPEGSFAGTGAAFFALVHPDDRARVEASVRQAIATGALYECDFRIVRPDGATPWVSNRGRCSFDAAGRPVQVLGTLIDVSARRHAEEGLRRHHETFARLVDDNPFGVYVVDADFRLQRVSQGAQKVFAGVHPLIGRDFAEVIRVVWAEPFATEVIARFRQTLASGEPFAAPTSVERRADSGEQEAYDWRIERVGLPDGRDGVVCYFYDLSERRRLEAVLEGKERELRSLTDTTPDVLSRFDRALRHVFVNAAVERATGRPREAFLGRTNRELGMPEALCDRWDAAIEAVFATGEAQRLDFTFDGPEGPSHFHAHMMPERGPHGDVEFVLGITHDVTLERRVSDAMRANEERLRLALSAAGAGAWEWDLGLDAITWSVETFGLYGLDPDGAAPTYALWESRVHPEDLGPTNAAVRAALDGSAPELRAEFRVLHPERGLRWVFSIGRVEFAPTGAPQRMVGINLDISERKRHEQVLAEADQRKDEFLATLAHELRNPLAPIRNGVALLRMAGPTEPTASVLAMMDRQSRHLVHLVDDLLDVSRVRSGKIALRPERLTLQQVVEAAVEACRPAIDEKGHRLALDLAAAPLTVRGDRTRLVQVVGNLLTNAAKYTEPGGDLRVTLRAVEGPGGVDGHGQGEVRVADTGVGLAAAQLPTIWDLFTQVRDTLDKAQGGLGIGLSLVRRLVAMHGGTVTAESEGLGRGSTFTVRLPLAAPADMETTDTPAEPPARRPAERRWRVLIVEDSADAAESLSLLLQSYGHLTHAVHDGAAGLAAAGTFAPDVILLDLGLPGGMDGYEVARRLRAGAVAPSCLIVALTGWGTASDRRKTLAAGFDHHLTKPIEMDALERALASLAVGAR